MKKPHQYWYYFSCKKEPVQIPKGTSPMRPYKRFETKKECQEYINSKRITP